MKKVNISEGGGVWGGGGGLLLYKSDSSAASEGMIMDQTIRENI